MKMNPNDPKDGAELRERVVAEGNALREHAVKHSRELGDGLALQDAPMSPSAPPAYPAPPFAAPPYPSRPLMEILPATPRAVGVGEALDTEPAMELASPDSEPQHG
jgi:hypothetical protein